MKSGPVDRSATATRRWRFGRWRLRTGPGSARAFLLLVEFTAIATPVSLLLVERLTQGQWVRLAVLAVMALAYAEGGVRIEKFKRYLSPGGHKVQSDQVSVWAFAAVLTVPAGWGAALIALLYGQHLARRTGDGDGVPYRVVFTGATVVLAAQAASALVARVGHTDVLRGGSLGPFVVIGALLIFTCVNFVVLRTETWLTGRPPTLWAMRPEPETFGHEIASLALGVVTAEFLLHSLALTPLALILAAYLHRSSWVDSLHRASRTDSKTGLANLTAWTEHAQLVLTHSHRQRQAVTVLFCDLDHFKVINDLHGHQAGDRVLTSVAHCLRRELRGPDSIGRFGGEEFVIILDTVSQSEAENVANRIRVAVCALRFDKDLNVTISVGVAHHRPGPADPELQELIGRADQALRRAKADGRNCVRTG